MFNKGGHGKERENCWEHFFHIESVNSIGCKHRPHKWTMDVFRADHIMEQGWTGQVTLISISDHLLYAIPVDHVTIALR